ncbi:hypothetical protein BRARA_H00799 [Brassica rapa]|uniref:Uncharacterized protein n=1 Tax=Brassica campestris TaxID=3711 RepID=A0A397YJB7_BRACM|nr:hypothetical protein BRARA_H00799 [Brassica rapa]
MLMSFSVGLSYATVVDLGVRRVEVSNNGFFSDVWWSVFILARWSSFSHSICFLFSLDLLSSRSTTVFEFRSWVSGLDLHSLCSGSPDIVFLGGF